MIVDLASLKPKFCLGYGTKYCRAGGLNLTHQNCLYTAIMS